MPHGLAEKTLDLIAASKEILAAEQPLTVRGVCYRLFNRKLIPNMATASTKRVSAALTTARERDMIPWHWIVDETRKITPGPVGTDPDGFIEEKLREYRRDHWESQPERVYIVSEKGTVSGILRPVLSAYGVPWVVFHGFGSASALNQLAEISVDDDRPLTLLYVGDHDPTGRHMSDVDIPERLTLRWRGDDRTGGARRLRPCRPRPDDLPGQHQADGCALPLVRRHPRQHLLRTRRVGRQRAAAARRGGDPRPYRPRQVGLGWLDRRGRDQKHPRLPHDVEAGLA